MSTRAGMFSDIIRNGHGMITLDRDFIPDGRTLDDLSAWDQAKIRAAHVEASVANQELVKRLRNAKAAPAGIEPDEADIFNACRADMAQLLRELIEQNEARLATCDTESRTLLHVASGFGSADCLRFLLGCVRDGSYLVASEKYRPSDRFDGRK